MRAQAVVMLLVALVAATGACGDDDADGPVVLSDPGGEVAIGVGEEVVVDLESIAASTGFSWELRRPVDEAVFRITVE
jgi:hypothetical protein